MRRNEQSAQPGFELNSCLHLLFHTLGQIPQESLEVRGVHGFEQHDKYFSWTANAIRNQLEENVLHMTWHYQTIPSINKILPYEFGLVVDQQLATP